MLMLVTTRSNAVLFNNQSLGASSLQIYNSAKKPNHLLDTAAAQQPMVGELEIATILAASSAIVTVIRLSNRIDLKSC